MRLSAFILGFLHTLAFTHGVTNVNVALMQRLTDLREPTGAQTLSDNWRTVAVGSLLGIKDFNEKNSRYVPQLSSYSGCDVQLNPKMFDTGSNARGSIIAYRAARQDAIDNGYDLHGIVGAARSDASKPMATLAGIDGIPQVSYWSTSDDFDLQHGTFPYFARTIPADSAVAKAAAELFNYYGHNYVGIAFVQDAYGEAYKNAFVSSCNELGIDVSTQSFTGGNEEAIHAAIDNFALERLKVGIAIIFDNDFDRFFEYATAKGLCGPGTLWILSEATSNGSVLAKTGDLQVAVNGMGRLLSQGGVPGNTHYDSFLSDWTNNFDSQSTLINYFESNFVSYTADSASSQPAGTDLSQFPANFFATNPPDDVATYAYDAAITLGIAACEYLSAGHTFDSSFSVDEYYNKIKDTSFSSVSGNVEFDETGSRTSTTGNYMLYNFKVDAAGVTTVHSPGSWTAAENWNWGSIPFQFSDGTTTPPTDIDIPEHDKQFLGSSLVAVGNTLVLANYLIAIILGVLTYLNRKHKVIRCSQPMFLYMVLLGCMTSTTTIYFMGIDDNQAGMSDSEAIDFASQYCMYVPAFYSLGFIFSFSALFAKITRIAKIFGNKKLQRVTITVKDMMIPIVCLMVVDILLLILWGTSDKGNLQWVRTNDLEIKGYPIKSTGMCSAEDPWPFLAPIICLHFGVLIYGNVMCYKARNAGTAFSESKYVFIAMVSNLQIMALGLPVLWMVSNEPVTNYFIRSGIIFMNDVGVMLLIFIPKLSLVYFGSEEDLALATSTSAGKTATGSNSTSTGAGAHTQNNDDDTER